MENNKSGIESKNVWIARRKKDLRSVIIDLLNQYSEVPVELFEEHNEHCKAEPDENIYIKTMCGKTITIGRNKQYEWTSTGNIEKE
ncbi:Uncharacterised protein [Chryseobacterium gleum]|uniref:Uncharacterized protein n=2 Tax=Chryseobacterium gleum TaxID=250 RepID=A0A448B832_CHRGE|nr:hypothetical protein [Chryseobacterium gleum]EFK36815.1 hypothetical protein HMPREF0204_11372 [Chryseobacterium gleum ATCC 35910]QQY32069.1 hypothetical protein I6I60_25110 [Chryseobacterium gleum]VEE10710.1 Uncharacterised protein [Chryseobacterium gleum]